VGSIPYIHSPEIVLLCFLQMARKACKDESYSRITLILYPQDIEKIGEK
jgi:hypothetical protein